VSRQRVRSDGVTDLAERSMAAPSKSGVRTQPAFAREPAAPITGRVRFAGLSSGALSFVGAWMVGAAIARLTGAAAVLLLLAATLVGFGAAVVSGRRSLRTISVRELAVAPLTTVGTETAVALQVSGAPIHRDGIFRLSDGAHELATIPFNTLDQHGTAHLTISFTTPGIVERLHVDIVHAGPVGLTWMRRTDMVPIEPVWVAPLPLGPGVDVETASSSADGAVLTEHGPKHGDIDGVRTWRDGDGDTSVHWPSTLRAGSLIVHDREISLDRQWIVDLPAHSLDLNAAARVTHTLLEGLRMGHRVTVRRAALDDADLPASSAPVAVTQPDEARRWGAELIGVRQPDGGATTPWYRRTLHIGARADTFTSVGTRSRWLTALASLIALGMLIGALGADPTHIALGAGGLVIGTLISLWCARAQARALWLRILVAIAALGALASIASTVGGVNGLLEALRGPMPDLLMLLLVIHGFEVVDRRTLRVHQAIGGVIMAYATGLRIDDRVGFWLAAWAVAIVAAVRATTRHDSVRQAHAAPRSHRFAKPIGAAFAAVVATLAVLSIVPVPDGPARLGLPALSNGAPKAPTDGGLASPSGAAPAPSEGTRGSLGEVGGYAGFAETMDTSVRGDLSNQIVMRVRSPKPDFWRGQTFTEFDGRLWSVSPDVGQLRNGPRIDVPASLGDLPRQGVAVETEELVQTYYVEADLPNVVFAAARPDVVTLDGAVYTRPDGALRSDVTLNEGSVYTVVSKRIQVTPESLRAQGDISDAFAMVIDPARRSLIEPYLAIPASTTQRTIDLANDLRRPGASTYDTIVAYQSWLSLNTEYDLNAPIPAEGADAVDDYLFVSQRGFCEQIASSLAIMLRSQGVPTRIATGYIPGVRDKVSGVFEVRASDAHAWVEVWFPDSGWQAFDPTASVPLSGEAEQGSVGADLASAAVSGIASRPVEIGLLVGFGILALGAFRAIVEFVRRRQRGRWGVLQDRFTKLTDPDAVTNPERATEFGDPAAIDLATMLDQAAFDPTWHDTSESYKRASTALKTLEKTGRFSSE
jgi:transglutaminase-like putative cysteine protease